MYRICESLNHIGPVGFLLVLGPLKNNTVTEKRNFVSHILISRDHKIDNSKNTKWISTITKLVLYIVYVTNLFGSNLTLYLIYYLDKGNGTFYSSRSIFILLFWNTLNPTFFSVHTIYLSHHGQKYDMFKINFVCPLSVFHKGRLIRAQRPWWWVNCLVQTQYSCLI